MVDIIHTSLHEVAHFIQEHTDKDFENYDTYTKRYGLQDNPFEIEANRFASANINDCMLYLEKNGLVTRV